MPIKKNAWEYLDLKTTKIPKNIRNTANVKDINDFLKSNKKNLSKLEVQYLEHRIASLNKINNKITEVKKQVNAGTYKENKTDVVIEENLGKYMLKGVDQPAFQTADYGCWSCFYLLALKSRGINDLTQEDIRAFRPNGITDTDSFTDAEVNSDNPINAIDMGDLAINLLPDTMIKSTEISSYNRFKGKEPRTFEEQIAYSESVINYTKEQIITAIRDHHSPVGLMMDGHYITITGIEGDIVHYKNSMPGQENSSNPNYTYQANIHTLMDAPLNGENAGSLTITYLADIKLIKDHTNFYDMPCNGVSCDDNGNVRVKTWESQAPFMDERHKDGMVIGISGGYDVPDNDSEYRNHLTDGFFKIDKVYMPRKVNTKSLVNKAKNRPDEEENALNNDLKTKENKRSQLMDDISKKKKLNKKIEKSRAHFNKKKHFTIAIDYNAKIYMGGNNFVTFKDNLSSMGWDKDKYDTLLCAFGGFYTAFHNKNIPNQKEGTDIVFLNSIFNHMGTLGNIGSIRRELEDFKKDLYNGTNVYTNDGREINIKGIKTIKPPTDLISKSVKYLNTYIDTLKVIEELNPNLTMEEINVDDFIDEKGLINYDAIYSDPVICPFAANNNIINNDNDNIIEEDELLDDNIIITEEDNGRIFITVEQEAPKVARYTVDNDGNISLSPKCKFKILPISYSWEMANTLLNEHCRDKDVDPNVIFTLILLNSHWKPSRRGDSIILSEEDYNYLADRYENDPTFAQNMEDLVKYGAPTTWDEFDALCNYIYHADTNHIVAVEEIETSHERRGTALFDDEIDFREDNLDNLKRKHKSDKKLNKAAENTFKHLITSAKGVRSFLDEKEKNEQEWEANNSKDLFAKFKNDIKNKNNHYRSTVYHENPTIDYYSLARIITRNQVPHTKLTKTMHYEDDFWKRNNEVHQLATSLANDLTFNLFVKENLDMMATGNITGFIGAWNSYSRSYKGKVGASSIEKDIDTIAFAKKSDDLFSKSYITYCCQNKIKEANKKDKPFKRDEMVTAVDYIIAKTLMTKAADVSFFNKISNSTGILDEVMFNDMIRDMRKEINNDINFKLAFVNNTDPKKLYDEYHANVAKTINKHIASEDARSNTIKNNKALDTRMSKFMSEHRVELDDDQVKAITNAYENLLEYNKGKKPSDPMKNLMKALKMVYDKIKEDRTLINMQQIDNLNRTALKYYDKRQGLIFRPFTDDGQSRLATIGDLARVTEDIVTKMRAKHPELDTSKSDEDLAHDARLKKIAAGFGALPEGPAYTK